MCKKLCHAFYGKQESVKNVKRTRARELLLHSSFTITEIVFLTELSEEEIVDLGVQLRKVQIKAQNLKSK